MTVVVYFFLNQKAIKSTYSIKHMLSHTFNFFRSFFQIYSWITFIINFVNLRLQICGASDHIKCYVSQFSFLYSKLPLKKM